jgi:hypothetical protein
MRDDEEGIVTASPTFQYGPLRHGARSVRMDDIREEVRRRGLSSGHLLERHFYRFMSDLRYHGSTPDRQERATRALNRLVEDIMADKRDDEPEYKPEPLAPPNPDHLPFYKPRR